MAAGFHLRMRTTAWSSDEYFVRAVATAIGRHPRLLSLSVNNGGQRVLAAGAPDEISPLDQIIEGCLDLESASRTDIGCNFCLLSTRPAGAPLAVGHWRTLRELIARRALAVFDVDTWGRLRVDLDTEPVLLFAPALLGDRALARSKRVVVLVNDERLGQKMLGDITALVESTLPDAEIVVRDNRVGASLRPGEWLEPEMRQAVCHIHVGTPYNGRAHGRLVDSAACQVPVILFGEMLAAEDGLPPQFPALPRMVDEVHLMHAATSVRFGAAFRDLVNDVALRSQLIANAGHVCREHNNAASAHMLGVITGDQTEARS